MSLINKPKKLSETLRLPKISSAGGLVLNDENNILLMLKGRKWDMPKGRIESGESKQKTARREVAEETGLDFHKLSIQGKLVSTWHTTRHDDIRYLKKTHWYLMRYAGGDDATHPQIEEGILDCRWVNTIELANYLDVTQLRVRYVIDFWQKNFSDILQANQIVA
tara:strand:+ start:906 stop:1400 length:495 start_codon:yes stop_codon:yes gene_type:complete